MDKAITIGDVLIVGGAIGGIIIVLIIAYYILSAIASGYRH